MEGISVFFVSGPNRMINPRGNPAGSVGCDGFIREIIISTYCFCKFLLKGSMASWGVVSSFHRPFSRSVTRSSGPYTEDLPKRSLMASIRNKREEDNNEFKTPPCVFAINSVEDGLLI